MAEAFSNLMTNVQTALEESLKKQIATLTVTLTTTIMEQIGVRQAGVDAKIVELSASISAQSWHIDAIHR